MAEFIATDLQTIESNQNVLFTHTSFCSGNSIIHREGSGLVTLRGITNQCRARFKVVFGANVATPTGGTEGPISIAIAINGEPVPNTTMIVTPIDAATFFNINRTLYIDVPAGCCSQISVKNTTANSIDMQNANLIIERIA